ncbi:MAG: hypothetical protein JWR26_1372 [Pedosphaera sp.]|nr:hypothetical protein [Pedosphaera sp.]
MKNKPNAKSPLHRLPRAQRERVDRWLFEENVTYAELVERCRQLLNVEVSIASAHRYYKEECPKHRPGCLRRATIVRQGNAPSLNRTVKRLKLGAEGAPADLPRRGERS